MLNIKKNKDLQLILIFFLLFGCFGFYLFYQEKINASYQYNKNWTSVYFLNLQNKNLSFAIENYENKEINYVYSLKQDNNILISEEVKLKPQETKIIEIDEKYERGEIIINYENKVKKLSKGL